MARRDEEDDAPKTKAVNNAYTGMLALSLVALIVGCALLYLDYSQYGSSPPTNIPKAPPVQVEKKAPAQ